MSDCSWLRDYGSKILTSVEAQRVQFLIEVDLAEDQLDELFRQLRQTDFFAGGPAIRACLALAAVHAANRAGVEDTSFIELFFTRLGQARDDQAWYETYGPAIERFLHEVFQEPLRTGPYRFVGGVYRHAGIPRHGIGSFAALLQKLTTNYGYHFTRHEYETCCESTAKGFVSQFLKSDIGHEYTRDSARVLEQIRSGIIRDIILVPGYPSGFWIDLLERIQPAAAEGGRHTQIALPQLAIDTATWTLGVRIPPLTIKQGVWCGHRRVTTEWDPIRSGNETYSANFVSWALPWSPSAATAALFRATDGAFVAAMDCAAVTPGEYILVQRWDILPDAGIIEEDIGYCDWSGDISVRAWRIRLESGYRDGSLIVCGASLPSLSFAQGHPDTAFGSRVYLDTLPEVIVHSWNTEAQHLFAVCLETPEGTALLGVPDTRGRVAVPVSCPAQGVIRLVPLGRCRVPSNELPYLTFAVIPSTVRIVGPQGPVPIDTACSISAELPSGWSLKWAQPMAEPSPSHWTVPPQTWVLDGELSYTGISMRVSWRVPRVDVHLRTHHKFPNIIWRDAFDMSGAVIIQAPPGTPCVLYLRTSEAQRLLWEAGQVPASGVLAVRCIALRDELNSQIAPAAELMLFARKSTFDTGVYWLNCTSVLLDAVDCGSSRALIEAIPAVGPCLRTLATMRHDTMLQCSLELALETTPLQRLLCDCGILAGVIDGTWVEQSERELSRHASEAIIKIARWYREANSALGRPEAARRIREAFPGDIDVVPFSRWRDLIKGLLDSLERVSNLPRLIEEWRNEVQAHAFGRPVSFIRQRPQGEVLTQGAVRYLRSFSTPSDSRLRTLQAAAELFREAKDSPEELISQIATTLWWVTMYRLGTRPADATIPPTLSAWLGPAQRTLCRLFGFDTSGTGGHPEGLTLCDISPADEDGRLEVMDDA